MRAASVVAFVLAVAPVAAAGSESGGPVLDVTRASVGRQLVVGYRVANPGQYDGVLLLPRREDRIPIRASLHLSRPRRRQEGTPGIRTVCDRATTVLRREGARGSQSRACVHSGHPSGDETGAGRARGCRGLPERLGAAVRPRPMTPCHHRCVSAGRAPRASGAASQERSNGQTGDGGCEARGQEDAEAPQPARRRDHHQRVTSLAPHLPMGI